MGRWDNLADADRLVLKEAQLPAADKIALEQAFGARRWPRSAREGGRLPSPASIRCGKQAYCRFAGHLRRLGRLAPNQAPIDRPTDANLDSFYQELVAAGLAGHTVNFYFQALRQVFQRMYPDRDFKYITHPDGISLRQQLDLTPRDVRPPAIKELIQLAQDCFEQGLLKTSSARGCGLIRDAAIQAVLCDEPPRRRALGAMRDGDLQKRGEAWWSLFEPPNTKKRRVEQHCLAPWTWPIIECYMFVARVKLLAGRSCGSLWLKAGGRPLTERGVVARIQWHSEKRFGKGFGPHMYRYAVAIAEADNPSAGPFSPSIKLGHSNPNSTLPYLREAVLDGVARRQAVTLEEMRSMTKHIAERSDRERQINQEDAGGPPDLPTKRR